MTASDWASWVQALGTIGALLIAVAVATYQTREARRLERERIREADSRRIEAVRALVTRTFSIAIGINATIDMLSGSERIEALDQLDMNHLVDCTLAINRLPVFEIPSAMLIVHVAGIPRAVDNVVDAWSPLSAPPNKVRSLHKLKLAVTELIDLCRDTIGQCALELKERTSPPASVSVSRNGPDARPNAAERAASSDPKGDAQ